MTEMVTHRAMDRLRQFLALESAGGIILMGAAVLAMATANTPLRSTYEAVLALPFEVRLGQLSIAKPLLLWVNDGLMAVFFFLVGLELKREMREGHLSSLRRASLPAIAAVGGMAAPALVYWWINRGDPIALQGWAIPAATDIAFALGVLLLLGERVPAALKAFLLSVAIFDDLGAIAVIAMFYTADLSIFSLGIAGSILALLAVLHRLGVSRPSVYIVLGIPLWVALLKSGVHATLAGVALALFIPMEASPKAARRGAPENPLTHLEHLLHPWVAFGVLPLFAFANAGVPLAGLSFADLTRPVSLGIVAGLFLGKQIGILGASAIAVRVGLAALPAGVRWVHIYGAAVLSGVGFTMSLFIASLAFEPGQFQGIERLGILMGSLLSGIFGYFVLRAALRGRMEAN